MDTLLEVGRMPTPPKKPVQRNDSTSSRANDAGRPPSNETDTYKSPERRSGDKNVDNEAPAAHRRETSGHHTEQKSEAHENAEGKAVHSTEGESKERSEDAFLNHLNAAQNVAKKPLAEKAPQTIELIKAPPKVVEFTPPKTAQASVVNDPLTDKLTQIALSHSGPSETAEVSVLDKAVSVEPVKAAFAKPMIAKAAPVNPLQTAVVGNLETAKTAAIKIDALSADVASVKAAHIQQPSFKLSEGLIRGPFPPLPQNVQSAPFSEVSGFIDIDPELKLELGERLSFRSADAKTSLTAQMAISRAPAGFEAPPILTPQGAMYMDPGATIEPGLDIVPLKQALSNQLTQVSSVSTSAQTVAQTQMPAAAQLVAAIKTERVGNSSNIEVRLDPPELGRVRIDFSLETADAVKAVLTVERSETLEYLRRNMTDLMDQLRQAGFTTVDLEFANRDASQFEQAEAGAMAEADADMPLQKSDIVYLSLSDNAQMDLLV